MKSNRGIMVFFILMTLICVRIYGDIPPGVWITHPSFTGPAKQIIETDDKIYYLTGGSLFSHNLKSEETISYTYGNPLNDWEISGIYYSESGKYLLIAYQSGNIDILNDNGSIINTSDIKFTPGLDYREINDVKFEGKTAYIATGFGLVVLDTSTGKIKDSGKYKNGVDAVALKGNKIFIVSDGKLMSADKNERINREENFIELGKVRNADELYAFSETEFMLRSNKLIIFVRMSGNEPVEHDWIEISDKPFIYGEEGIYTVTKDNQLYRIGYDGIRKQTGLTVSPGYFEVVGGRKPEEKIWMVDRNGISEMTNQGGTWVTTSERYIPQDALTVKDITFIIPGGKEESVYFGNIGSTLYRMTATDGLDVVQELTVRRAGKFEDMAARNVEGDFFNVKEKQARYGKRLITPQRFCEDPLEAGTYFAGTGNDGLYKIVNKEFAGKYDGSNSPIPNPWGYRVFEVSIDRGGNLWIGGDGTGNESGVAILPAEKRLSDPSMVSKSDWKIVDMKGMPTDKDMRIFHCKHSPVTLIFNWSGDDGLIAYHNGNTPEDLSDDVSYFIHRLVDQDGIIFIPERFTSIAEDRDGKVWIGCEGGVVEISNPNDAKDSQLSVRRLKISHNDGTGLADYFCGTDMALDISVDGANRKWVSTGESGVYLLNAEGTEILENFTADNSPLPSNEVKSVYCDPLSNSIFFGTSSGLVEYGGTATIPEKNFSQIKVYPNPITPETSVNFVTITGLTDGTLVKITDNSGGQVWQGKSEGGMAQWPIETASGRRVRSGVYYVFLSSENNGSAVAKILVIN